MCVLACQDHRRHHHNEDQRYIFGRGDFSVFVCRSTSNRECKPSVCQIRSDLDSPTTGSRPMCVCVFTNRSPVKTLNAYSPACAAQRGGDDEDIGELSARVTDRP